MSESFTNTIAFIDIEVNPKNNKVMSIGGVKQKTCVFHSPIMKDFQSFVSDCDFICGHNIINHDLKYLNLSSKKIVDTLYLSPLLFPKNPYHHLLKNDKIVSDELNNPVNDSKKAMDLFFDEINAFQSLPNSVKKIYSYLLADKNEFKCFFQFIDVQIQNVDDVYVKNVYKDKICENVELSEIIKNNPVELAYALAIIGVEDDVNASITPPWVLKQYPMVEVIIKKLCNTPCSSSCSYCNSHMNIHFQLKKYFDYSEFRKYEGEPLQENACRAAVENKSLIAIFPTGGGKSLTFQLPALIAGDAIRGLTVIISPLQSLMKDQIDNLEKRNIVNAVSINGLLNPIERAEAISRVKNGLATILYLSPEQLRSKTIEHLLLGRNVVRFVIDEAHCFSAWGQDFRVDYLYIGDFIKKLQEQKGNNKISVSCFTATAKPKVIVDIKDYFKEKLGLNLDIYASNTTRENLRYEVRLCETFEQKYNEMRTLIEMKNCSTIVYVDSVQKTKDLAERLTKDGFVALPYNGKMESRDKVETQEKFINDEVKIIVATSAFGMGVDKQDIELIIHFNAPSSLEDYVQESGRAAREQSLNADCYILFSPDDIDKHFIRLNQQKLTLNEIQQIWSAIKRLTKRRKNLCRSAVEIAREAGWNKAEVSNNDVETKVKTAIMALEKAGYLVRGQNMPRVYATSINVKNVIEAQEIIKKSGLFNEEQQKLASLVISKLISSRSRTNAGNDDAESRIDWLADSIGVEKQSIITVICLMKQVNVLSDDSDMNAVINDSPEKISSLYSKIESCLINFCLNKKNVFSLKSLNEKIQEEGVSCEIKYLRTILNYWKISSYIEKGCSNLDEKTEILLDKDIDEIKNSFNKRTNLSLFIIDYLKRKKEYDNSTTFVSFSTVELLKSYKNNLLNLYQIEIKDVEEALLWLHRIHALSLEGGFLVLYNSLEIIRIVEDNKIKYKKDDYRFLDDYYKQKIQQIHIIGELLNILVKSYKKAIEFIKDYFMLDYKAFMGKYFKGRDKEIQINMTPGKYKKLFGELSDKQQAIINDDVSKYIVVAAGPGSGKTKVLAHKLASLLTLEDIKSEQLLMLTFSRAAAIEFKKRLQDLIGASSSYVEIKTFHSFCFDILGRCGSLEKTDTVIKEAVKIINEGVVEASRIAKAVLVIDEAQDMSKEEFSLIEALINFNDEMRVIAVGDDDQNIYEFRGSDSKYFQELINKYNAKKYEMVQNYRSCKNIVEFANEFAETIQFRMKEEGCITYKKGGIVKLIKYSSENIEVPIVERLLNDKLPGSTCVLTNTNDEALKILGILNKKGIPARLIQSLDKFNLFSLQEIKFILWFLNKHNNPVQISDDLWTNIKLQLHKTFSTSANLSIVLKMLDEFEKTNTIKYYSDLETFFYEAKFEDFYDNENGKITISTVHKAKGHEYDNVYMLIKNSYSTSDDKKREIYVGLTRAKNNLTLCYNGSIFDQFVHVPFLEYEFDDNKYNKPDSIILQLTHQDVFLDYFIKNQNIIRKLRSGTKLIPQEDYLLVNFNNKDIKILKYSSKCKNRIQTLISQGYTISEASINFIVFWKKTDDELENEYAIILPNIKFSKKRI